MRVIPKFVPGSVENLSFLFIEYSKPKIGMCNFWQNYNKFALAIPSKINIIALDFKRLALNGNTL